MKADAESFITDYRLNVSFNYQAVIATNTVGAAADIHDSSNESAGRNMDSASRRF